MSSSNEPGPIDQFREKWPWFDHLMYMNERYSKQGGNFYAAAITYFSVLSLFPLLMLAFGVTGLVLRGRPETLTAIQERITNSVDGELGTTLTTIVDQAVSQAGAVFSIGALVALWTGLGWMSNLRFGVSKQWKVDPTGDNFFVAKLRDLGGLISLLIALIIAFGVTAIGSSGLTRRILEWVGLGAVPGISILVRIVAILIGVFANFLVFYWLIGFLPRADVPKKSVVQGAILGAIAFEVFKQLGSLFFSNALSNPAGAAFGPIIGVMALLYFVWRILLYASAWAATTPQARRQFGASAPEATIIRPVVVEDDGPSMGTALGVGAAAGALGTVGLGVARKIRRWRKR